MACVVVWAAHFRLRGKRVGRARCVRLRFSARASGCCCSRVPLRLTIRSSRRRVLASLKLAVMRAILALHCCSRRGLTLALGGEKHSAFLLRSLQFTGFVCSAFRSVCRHVVSSAAVRCALKLGLRDGPMACAGVWAAHFRLRGTCVGRARGLLLRFSATASGWCCSWVPKRLTIRSSRRRFLASLKLPAVQAILVLHCCGRRGLTLALGG